MLLAHPESHDKITKMLLAERVLLTNTTELLLAAPEAHDEIANRLLKNDTSHSDNPSKRGTNTHQLDLTRLDPDIFTRIMTEAVLATHDPSQRVKEICKSFSQKNRAFLDLCHTDSALYDMLNRKLGWYGESNSHKERAGEQPVVWFLECCRLYKTYGEKYWCRYEHGKPVTVKDIGL
eukprot:5952409-Prymnesium_polylepis.1